MRGDQRRSMVLARILGGIGRAMITAGVLLLLFVAYQLWGTGIRTAQAQNGLEDDFAESLEEADGGVVAGSSTTTTSTSTTLDPAVTTTSRLPVTTAPPLDPALVPLDGEAAGQLVIPSIGLDWIFVEGVSVSDLKKGPGHYPETPLPGQAGNAAIAGHRTTYGAPFGNLDALQPGDEVQITTVQGQFSYEVRATEIVSPSQVEVLDASHWPFANALTLTACHPKYSARQRIVVGAELVGQPAPPTPRAVEAPSAPAQFESNLSGERAHAWPAILWASVCAAIWLVAWLVGRRNRRAKWPAYFVGVLPFLVALFFFFENFSRLLPANY